MPEGEDEGPKADKAKELSVQRLADRANRDTLEKRFSLDNFGFWIGVFLVLLVVLNSLFFWLYLSAFPGANLAEKLWQYFESDTFKVVTASLIFPIVAFLVENRFKVAERFTTERRASIKKHRTEQEEGRREAIQKTEDSWRELYALCSRVRHFNKRPEANPKEGERIEDILRGFPD